MELNITKLGPKFQKSVGLITEHLGLSISEDGIKIRVYIQGKGIEIIRDNDGFNVNIAKDQYLMRALGLLVERIKAGDTDINIKETPSYNALQIMLDCSRDGVMNFRAYKEFVIYTALMGYTSIQLYQEAVHEIEEYPYFKGTRTRYSQEELKEMSAYAADLFVELIPVVQALPCSENIFKWKASEDKKMAKLAHETCKKNNIKKVIIMPWGDTEAKSSVFSILPTLQLWAELCYNNNSEKSHVSERFETCTQGSYESFLKLDMPMLTPKYILYQDILSGVFDLHIDKATYTLHFQKCSREFENIIRNQSSKWNYIFETEKILCDILSIKSHCGINIRQAYKEGNKERLEQYATIFLPDLIQKFEDFILAYRKQWISENKIIGLDIFDIRMGGLVQRIKTTQLVIDQYLNDEIAYIDEFK